MAGSSVSFHGNERFVVRQRLGAGGMGEVYEAFDRESQQSVALKTLTRVDAAAIYRFKREFRALADVTHPNLVSLYELVAEGDAWFFTMELVRGVDFLQFVRSGAEQTGRAAAEDVTLERGSLTLAARGRTMTMSTDDEQPAPATPSRPVAAASSVQLARLRAALKQLAEGVQALHQLGTVHRDLKPSNVLVTAEGRVVILDFGLISERLAETDQSGVVVGTPAYMAPEQAAGHTVSEASDWYSVGLMLFEALTGRLPFTGDFVEIASAKLERDASPPSELGLMVPEDLDALCADLLRRDPQLRPPGNEILDRLGSSPADVKRASAVAPPSVRHTAFVGRGRDLAALRDAFRASLEGRTVNVYVHGTSGIGKTTLVRQFLDELRLRDAAVVLAGRCFERESVPYKALDGVVDNLTRYLLSLPRAKADALMPRDVLTLSRLFPVLLRVESVVNAPQREQATPDPQELRRRAFAALAELLARIADRQPLVISIDDLQWADADSLVFLEEMLRSLDPAALLGIASFRSEEVETKPFLKALLARTGSEGRRELALEPLSAEEARDLTLSLLPPEVSRDPDLVETVVREAGGSPFLVEQLTGHALGSEGAATGVSLAQMLEARMALLPPGARPLLEALAVVGRPVDVRVIHQAAGLTGDDRPLLASLRSAQLVRSSVSANRVELYHDRIRETLTGLLQPEAVRRSHRRLAETFEACGLDDPEALFEHWLAAGDEERAAAYAASGARRASAALAFDRAVLLYRRALELSPPAASARIELKQALAEALANAGRSAEAAQVYLEAAAEGAIHALEFQRRAAEQLLISGHIDEGLKVIRKVLAAVGMKLPAQPALALLSMLARRAQLRLRGLRFVQREARDVPEDILLRIDICWSVAAGLALVDIIRAADFQTRHLLLALQAGEPYRVARALAVEAAFESTVGGPGRKRRALLSNRAEKLARDVGHPHALGLFTLTAGISAFCFGEWRRGAELCDRAEKILREQCTGVAWELTNAQAFLLDCLVYLGELREAGRRLPELHAGMRERGNLYGITQLDTRGHVVWIAADDPERARRQVMQALGRWSHSGFQLQHYNASLALTQVSLYTGDAMAAWESISGQWASLRRSLLLRNQMLRVEATHLRARCALAMAEHDVDPDGWLRIAEQLARRIERERMPWSDPLALLLRAAVASRRRQEERAAALLSTAAEGFTRSDMGLYAAAAQRHLGRLLGGVRGRELVTEAESKMQEQRIQRPDLVSRMLAPGFPASEPGGASPHDGPPGESGLER